MRLQTAQEYLKEQQITIAHTFMLWCQGESDGDAGTTALQYQQNFQKILSRMQAAGVEQCFLIQIGHFNYIACPDGIKGVDGLALDSRYGVIRNAQAEILRKNQNVISAGSFENCISFMKDAFHYHQPAYDEVGKQAAERVANWLQKDIRRI